VIGVCSAAGDPAEEQPGDVCPGDSVELKDGVGDRLGLRFLAGFVCLKTRAVGLKGVAHIEP
jgi:hypothetical protein